MYELQKNIGTQFRLSFDYFGRSSSISNHELSTEIFEDLQKNGYIEKRLLKQYYSKKDQRFLPDRYVMGICPKCAYEKARGDQCDGCGALLDPIDLKNPYSSISGDKNLELRESEHFFLKLDALQDKVQNFVETHEWNSMTKGIARKWLHEGLKERCISRDLKWGIPIPNSDKVFYVWFDAPNAYISITRDLLGKEKSDTWWKNATDVVYTQFMAKDNVPFHAIFWPAMLMGTGKDWKQVDVLKSFAWLTYEGGKFSTSQKRGIFMDQALNLYPSDYWRYYLLAHIPETDDADFSFENFAQTINKDLANILGNFVNRTISLVHKYYDGQLPYAKLQDVRFDALVADYKAHLYALQFRQALMTLRKIWDFGNEFLTVREPWKMVKVDPEGAATVLSQALWLIRQYAELSAPIIPDVCETMKTMVEITHKGWSLKETKPLFSKITDETIHEYGERFRGRVV